MSAKTALKNLLTGRTLTATVEVTFTPRDVALLASTVQGHKQGDTADIFGVGRMTVVQAIDRTYDKLGVKKQGEAVGKALTSDVLLPSDLKLTPEELRSLWAAGDDWGKVGAAVATPAPKTTPKTTPKRSKVTTRKLSPAEQKKADAAKADVALRNRQSQGQ